MIEPATHTELPIADVAESPDTCSSPARRRLLAASPMIMLTPSLASLMASETVEGASVDASAGNLLPGYWSPTDTSLTNPDGPIGTELWKRADRVMPSGAMFLTRSARYSGYHVMPGFIAEAQGARVTDVDGRSYIDMNCGNGPNLLGWRHPEVEAAARAQAERGDLMPLFPPAMIEFCERLLKWTDGFAWAVPVKRGSDSTELAMRVARAATKRPHVIMFKNSYHGTMAEQSLFFEGEPKNELEHVSRLPWNDVAALDRFMAPRGEQVAAILLSPIDQTGTHPAIMPSKEFIAAIDRLRKRTGALLIMDDVRAGFRMHPKGSHKAVNVVPDLLCLGKALGNGHAAAAVLGTEPVRGGAERILYTSTYLFSAVCFKAAIATLDVYERDDAFAKIQRAGDRLRLGMMAAAKRHGQAISLTGPVTHPSMLFDNDPRGALAERFSHEAAKRGALMTPRLPYFLSAAHDDGTIDEVIDVADKSFAAMPVKAPG